MNYLTPSELHSIAPGAARLKNLPAGYLDTGELLARLRRTGGYRPIYATQGTGHFDAALKPQRGRHLVVVANDNCEAVVILNSHSVHRRAWLGLGEVSVGLPGSFVVGPALPLRRWRGPGDTLAELYDYRDSFQAALATLKRVVFPENGSTLPFAEKMAAAIYLPGHKQVAAEELADTVPGRSVYAQMHGMLLRAREGGLRPATRGRRVKPIRGPDAVMNAACGAFLAACQYAREADSGAIPWRFPGYR
jgi:hypothetical protein